MGTRSVHTRWAGGVLLAVLLAQACSSSDEIESSDATTTEAPVVTVAPTSTTATTPPTEPPPVVTEPVTTPPPTTPPPTTVAPTTPPTTPTTVPPTVPPTTAAPTIAPPACPTSWTMDPKVTVNWPSSAPGATQGKLADAGIGAHAAYDRFVLDFEQADIDLSYDVKWIAGGPTYDAIGDPVPMLGDSFMEVRVIAVASWAQDPADWYTGPTDLLGTSAGTVNLLQAVQTGDFEGYVTWHIGADYAAPFQVFTLPDPTRLVVDICSIEG